MSETAVVNQALRRIGVARLGNLRTDTSFEAQVARDVYDDNRRSLLNTHAWKWATTRAELTEASAPPISGWDHAFPVPDNFIRLISVHPDVDDDAAMPYKLEVQSGQRVILCNSTTCFIRYVFDQQDAGMFSAAFRDVLAYSCAMDLAGGLNKPISVKQMSEESKRKMLARAKAIDGMEDFPDRMAEGSWMSERDHDNDSDFYTSGGNQP